MALDVAILSVVFLTLAILTTHTLFNATAGLHNTMDNSVGPAVLQKNDRLKTDLEIDTRSPAFDDTLLRVTVRNRGSSKIKDFSNMDLIITYNNGTEETSVWLPYSTDISAVSEGWSTVSLNPDIINPNIFDPGENLTVQIKLNDGSFNNVTFHMTITASNGGADSEWMEDVFPPYTISNLTNQTYEPYINWTWTNPPNEDFNKIMVYIDGVYTDEVVTPDSYYNATGFELNSTHTISIKTADTNGNINLTWVNHTAMTSPTFNMTPSSVSDTSGGNATVEEVSTIDDALYTSYIMPKSGYNNSSYQEFGFSENVTFNFTTVVVHIRHIEDSSIQEAMIRVYQASNTTWYDYTITSSATWINEVVDVSDIITTASDLENVKVRYQSWGNGVGKISNIDYLAVSATS